jgi:hypothetical protein
VDGVTQPAQRETIAEEWFDYLHAVVPKGASPVQVEQTRWAFYAGAQVMLSLCARLAERDAPGEELEKLQQELRAMIDQVGGR